jgi:hypothetical protein
MSTALPSEFRLIPARAGSNAVAVLQRRNLRTGTAIFKNIVRFYFLMSKNVVLILIVAAFAMISACGGADTTNTNSNVNANQANLPPEFQTKPISPSGNTTPGIPADPNISVNNPNGTPTPGIPDPANVNKIPKGTTPTPGIPDEKTLRKQMLQLRNGNVNAPPIGNANVKVKTVRKP